MEARAVKERGMLFRDEMVRAILAGRKTQTRRAIKGAWVYDGETGVGAGWEPPTCPYGASGDRLWVRETHYVLKAGYPDGRGREVLYRADSPDAPVGNKWTPAIHMFRWASRLTLEITEVRFEPLNDISEDDAIAEGVSYTGPYPAAVASGFLPRPSDLARREYRKLWESINGRGSWDANPWVWAINFRRVD